MVVENVSNSMQPCKTGYDDPVQGLRKCHLNKYHILTHMKTLKKNEYR